MRSMPSVTEFPPAQLETLHDCPFCGSPEVRYLFVERGFNYQECIDCRLIFLGTRVRERFIGAIYDAEGYHSAEPTAATRRTATKRAQLLQGLLPGAKVVEDGAGDGLFVAACRAAGHDAIGCDLGADAIAKAARVSGVELKQASLADLGLAGGSMDAVVCFNLLSHLYRPWEYMREVARVLRPGGLWLTRVGDKTGWKKRLARGNWSAPEHVYHFPISLLARMAGEAGLELAFVRPAFDSDFPQALSGLGRGWRRPWGALARGAAKASLLTWMALRLPRDDYYLRFVKTGSGTDVASNSSAGCPTR
jgi:SAM-dependent methyltransferase